MERILNDEDKLRRAEEIYYRRNNQVLNLENKLKTGKNKNSFWLNFLIMLNLAIIVFCIQNRNFIFTQEFLNTLNNYNVEASDKVRNFFKGIIFETDATNENILENGNVEKNDNNIKSVVDATNSSTNSIKKEENIVNESNIVSNQFENLSSTLNEMEEDVKNLKAAYSFISPLKRYC